MRKKLYRLDRAGLSSLFDVLKQEGYLVYGPTLCDHAIQWLPLSSLDDLPAGWTTSTAPATYRLLRDSAGSLFHYWTGPDSLKKVLHPARACITHAERDNGSFRIWNETPQPVKRAFFGTRACDLAAVTALDRVLLQDRFEDDIYKANRAAAFFVAVHCTSSAPTCFCASTGTGPQARSCFDIALHERSPQEYLAEPGSASGSAALEKLAAPLAPPEWAKELAESCTHAAAAQQRRIDLNTAPVVISLNFDHPRWDHVAKRCLSCGNCTSVCPTCFCVNFEDHTSLDLQQAERLRLWDSCFSQNFTYIHGGSIRLSPKSRYRHWLSHKLARWQEQFGTSGCVGCGRCIAWCPAGIDITEEIAALQTTTHAAAMTGVSNHGN